MFSVIDLLNGSKIDAAYAETALQHGVSCIHITVNNFSTINPLPDLRTGLKELAACRAHYRKIETHTLIVERYTDLARAREQGKLAVIFGYQNLPGIERDLGLLELLQSLGVRIIQIAHNVRNPFADGCAEPADAGLSRLGRELVSEMNRLRLLIDISHVGERSALDIISCSEQPVAATHANCFSVCDNVRNKSDAVLDALKSKRGLVGITYLPPLVRKGKKPTHSELTSHVSHARNRIGIEHLAIGSDFITGQPAERYEEFLRHPEVYGTWPGASPSRTLPISRCGCGRL
jgi:membrane dipeptidase